MPRPRATPARPVRRGTIPTPTPQPVQTTPSPAGGMPLDPTGVSSLMISSLPPMASGADVYARQFYRGSKVPYRRYLPLTQL